MHPLLRLFAAFAVLVLAGCYPTTRELIGIGNGITTDPRLIGAWQGKVGNDVKDSTIYILDRDPNPLEAIVIRQGDEKSRGQWSSFWLTPGKVGQIGVLNALWQTNNGDRARLGSDTYLPILYRFEADGTVKLFLLDTAAMEDQVRMNKLAGEIYTTGNDADILLTGDAKHLDAFFAANGAKFFTKSLGTFKKVK